MTCIFILYAMITVPNSILIDFSKVDNSNEWYVVDDVVMGGRSNGNLMINSDGNAVFYGDVSLENNGGFSSIRTRLTFENVDGHKNFSIRLKGDGKIYQFRIKSNRYERHSYFYRFQTTNEWQTIHIPMSEMIPTFRGYILDIPNYNGRRIDEISFMIANKKTEDFKLEIESIALN